MLVRPIEIESPEAWEPALQDWFDSNIIGLVDGEACNE